MSFKPFEDKEEVASIKKERDELIEILKNYDIPADERRFIFRKIQIITERNKVVGVVVAQGGTGDAGAITVFTNFFIIQKMIIVGRAVGYGREKGEVRNDRRGMAQAEALGETMAKYLNSREMPLIQEYVYKVETRLRESL